MRCRKLLFVFASMLVTLLAPQLGLCASCEGIQSTSFGSEVKIVAATPVAATASAPAYCNVVATIWPEISVAVQLPTNWNKRFYMVGGGGYAGFLASAASITPFLNQGFATASTDTGHNATKEPLGTFAWYDAVTNPNAMQKMIDYSFRGVHETAVLAKKIMNAYYGAPPVYSYFQGCSWGGHQALMEVQRFPDDFNGVIAGAPALSMTDTQMWDVWNQQALLDAGPTFALSAGQKLPILSRAVFQKCDSMDGLVDGLIDDPRKCTFDPAVDLPRCPGDVDGPTCFTNGQVNALKKIYDGPRNSAGKLLFPAQMLGGEASATMTSSGTQPGSWQDCCGLQRWLIGMPGNAPFVDQPEVAYGGTFMQYLAFVPPAGPNYDWRTYNFDTDPQRMSMVRTIMDPTNPDMSAFKQRGGKLILYTGLADYNITPYQTINYYEDVLKTMGTANTSAFMRFYTIPGAPHCRVFTGIGCDAVDWLTPVMAWVEKGVAPDEIVGSRVLNNQTVRTRPLCPYPEVARYVGTGSIDDEANFACVSTVPATVKFTPGTVSLSKGEKLVATIVYPKGYKMDEFTAIVCEGAQAVHYSSNSHTIYAEFNMSDMKNLIPGQPYTFTVTAIGKQKLGAGSGGIVAFEASSAVSVE